MSIKIVSYPDTLPGTIALGKALLNSLRGKGIKAGTFKDQLVIADGRKNLILVIRQSFNTFGAIDPTRLFAMTYELDSDEIPGDLDGVTYRIGIDMLGSPILHSITDDNSFFEDEEDLINQQSYGLIGNCDEPWLGAALYNTFRQASTLPVPLALHRRMQQIVLDGPVYKTTEYDEVNLSLKAVATPIGPTYFDTLLDQVPDDAIIDMLHSLLPDFETFPTHNGVPIFKGNYAALPQSKLKGNLLWIFASPYLTRQREDGEYISIFKCNWEIDFSLSETQNQEHYISRDTIPDLYKDAHDLPDWNSVPGVPPYLFLTDYVQNSWFSVYTKDIINSRFDTDHTVRPIAAASEPGAEAFPFPKTLNIFINGTTTNGDYNVYADEGDHHGTRLGLTLLDNILFDIQAVYATAGEGFFTFNPNAEESRVFPYDNSPQHIDYSPNTIAIRFFTSTLIRTENEDEEFTYEGRVSFYWASDWGGNYSPFDPDDTGYVKHVDPILYPEIIDSWWLHDLVPEIPVNLANEGWAYPDYYPSSITRAWRLGSLYENRFTDFGTHTIDNDSQKNGYITYYIGNTQDNRVLHYLRVLYEEYNENVDTTYTSSLFRDQRLKNSRTVLDFISKDIDFDGTTFTVTDSELITYNATGTGAYWSQSQRPKSYLEAPGYKWDPHSTVPGTFTLTVPSYDVTYSREPGQTELAYRMLSQVQSVTAATRLESGKYGNAQTFFKYADPTLAYPDSDKVLLHTWNVNEQSISEGLVYTDGDRFIAEPAADKRLFMRVGSDIYQTKANTQIYKNGEFVCDAANTILLPPPSESLYENVEHEAIVSHPTNRARGVQAVFVRELSSANYTTYGRITSQTFGYNYLVDLDPIEYDYDEDGGSLNTSTVNSFNINLSIPKFAAILSGDSEFVGVMLGIGDRIHHGTSYSNTAVGLAGQISYSVNLKHPPAEDAVAGLDYFYNVIYPIQDESVYRSLQGVFELGQAAATFGELILYTSIDTGYVGTRQLLGSIALTCIDKKAYVTFIRFRDSFFALPDIVYNEFMTPFYFRNADEYVYLTREQFQSYSNTVSHSFLYTRGFYLNRIPEEEEEEEV